MKYICRLGFEFHCVVNSQQKLFCLCKNDLDNLNIEPNEYICPTCTGLPGSLPKTVNSIVVEKAVLLSYALQCRTNRYLQFDRKHYVYHDLPKNYQITQFHEPIGRSGKLDLHNITVNFKDIHIEEDAGRTQRKENGDYLVDFNRAGVPLIEIVTDLIEVKEGEIGDFIRELGNKLKSKLIALKISNCNMEKGELRADVNFSLFNGVKSTKRVEIKNLNSFRFMYDALKCEIEKHKQYLENRIENNMETLLYDEGEKRTVTMRSKETALDYCYLPDPDIPAVPVNTEIFKYAKRNIDEYNERYSILSSYFNQSELNDIYIRKLDLFLLHSQQEKKISYQWALDFLRKWKTFDTKKTNTIYSFLKIIKDNKLSSSQSRVLFDALISRPHLTVEKLFSECHFLSKDELKDIDALLDPYFLREKELVKKIRGGKHTALNNLMGVIMRETQGKIDAQELRKALIVKLNIEG